jgi:hypothetical protein
MIAIIILVVYVYLSCCPNVLKSFQVNKKSSLQNLLQPNGEYEQITIPVGDTYHFAVFITPASSGRYIFNALYSISIIIVR